MSFLEKAKALRPSDESDESVISARSPGVRHEPTDADHELADRLGLEGARREFLQAVELVAELEGREPWTDEEALERLTSWWGKPVVELSPVDWILSAAHADEVLGVPRPRAGEGGPDG